MSGARSAKAGFTMIEVLAGLAVATMAIISLTFVVGIAARAWSRGDIDTTVTEKVGRAASRFADDVASLVPWRYASGEDPQVIFAGDPRQLTFAAVAQTGAYGGPRLRLVSYRFIAASGGTTVERRVAPMPANPAQFAAAEWSDPVTLIGGVANARFAYGQASAGKLDWNDTWPAGETLPSTVRMTFVVLGRSIVFDVPVLVDPIRDCQLPPAKLVCPNDNNPPPPDNTDNGNNPNPPDDGRNPGPPDNGDNPPVPGQ